MMLTFLEFYTTLMGFVLFKLYNGLGYHYPPALDNDLADEGRLFLLGDILIVSEID